MNDSARVTVVVVPRESFAQTERCLLRLLECTPAPRRIVVVDGGSPPPIAAMLREAARAHDVTLVRSDHLLTPNEARNIGLAHATTEWVAIIDNDAYVPPGWLDQLLDCADATGAAAVAPLYLIGEIGRERLHHAGGDYAITHDGDRRRLSIQHTDGHPDLPSALAAAQRSECGAFEFHAVLLRRDALAEFLPLDEGLRSLLEHVDLALLLKQRDHAIWYEPQVSITYIPDESLRGANRRYFVARWSDDWNERTAARFGEKWGLPDDDPALRREVAFGASHRAHAYRRRRWPRRRTTAGMRRTPSSGDRAVPASRRRARVEHREILRRLARPLRRLWRPLRRALRWPIDRAAQRAALREYRRRATDALPPRVLNHASWMQYAETEAEKGA